MAQFKLCWQSEVAILPFRLTTDLRLACCVIKMRENSLVGSANLFKGVNVIDIRTKWSGIFPRFELSRVSPTGTKIGSSYREFREIEGSRNRGWNCRAWVKQIQGKQKQGLVRDIGRFGKPRVREIGIALYILLLKTGSLYNAIQGIWLA